MKSQLMIDCTFALNPYFGFRYEQAGLGFNAFNNKIILSRFTMNDGSDSLIPRLLLTRATCLLEIGETELAFQDRRRLLLSLKILVTHARRFGLTKLGKYAFA